VIRGLAGALLLAGAWALPGLAADGVTRGTATQLPIDPELVGAWWRDHAPSAPAEAVHYDADGRYVLVRQDGAPEHGLWTTLVRGELRWLRRCPAQQGGVSPEHCSYFGRYMVGHGEPVGEPDGDGDPASEVINEALEEVACPDAWEGSLTGDLAYAVARDSCEARTHRFGESADTDGLREALQENASAPPRKMLKVPEGVPDAFAEGGGGGDVRGVWVGTVGSGPEQVRLVFSAMDDSTFYYTLEAGGQEETSTGTWDADGAQLILKHPTGEVERISFAVKGEYLQWKDEDIGTLTLKRQS
jgi:hypothetical protein